MKGVFLLLGTNLGDRDGNLEKAKKKINDKLGAIIDSSRIYQTDAWGKNEQPEFLNQVVQIETSLTPEQLMGQILLIEKEMGRKRKSKWEARIIDIDILFYNDWILKMDNLTIPHPEIKNRLFALVPLCDLVSNEKFPGENLTIERLKDTCPDHLKVNIYHQ